MVSIANYTISCLLCPPSARLLTIIFVSCDVLCSELLIEGLPFQRAKENWIMESKQQVAGYEDQLGFAPNKNKKETQQQRHAREEDLLEEQDVASTQHIKRKGSRREEMFDLQQ